MDFLSLWRKFRRQRARQCVLCHDSASDGLCAACLEDLQSCQTDARNCCTKCGCFLSGGGVCGYCQKKTPAFECLWSSVYYEAPVRQMIHEFKHLRDLSMRQPLAKLMVAHPPEWLEQACIDFIVAVPLSSKRRLYRGFNQSEMLAAALGEYFHLPVLPRNTFFRRHKEPQSVLKSSERLKNAADVFSVVKPLPPNCNLLLIDDVVTTGATLNELAGTLKKSGSGKVFCWTLARPQMKR